MLCGVRGSWGDRSTGCGAVEDIEQPNPVFSGMGAVKLMSVAVPTFRMQSGYEWKYYRGETVFVNVSIVWAGSYFMWFYLPLPFSLFRQK